MILGAKTVKGREFPIVSHKPNEFETEIGTRATETQINEYLDLVKSGQHRRQTFGSDYKFHEDHFGTLITCVGKIAELVARFSARRQEIIDLLRDFRGGSLSLLGRKELIQKMSDLCCDLHVLWALNVGIAGVFFMGEGAMSYLTNQSPTNSQTGESQTYMQYALILSRNLPCFDEFVPTMLCGSYVLLLCGRLTKKQRQFVTPVPRVSDDMWRFLHTEYLPRWPELSVAHPIEQGGMQYVNGLSQELTGKTIALRTGEGV